MLVTPSEKSSRNGQEAAPEAERTTVLASAGEDVPATDQPTIAVGQPETNGRAGLPAGPQEDHDLSAATPPPWQRVNYDTAFARAPVDADGPTIEAPAPPDRPVVTGTAASRLFGEPVPVPAPGSGYGAPPPLPRSTVHLEGTGTTGTMRPTTAAAPNVLRRPGRGPRRANLHVKRFDPWSVLKLSLVLGVALFFVWLVAVGALYAVLDGMGVWDKVNGISTDLLQGNEGSSQPLISAGRVFGIAAIVGAVNIVLFSALATVGAFVYNVSADLVGGLEVTLAERE
jgi:hypothetical protein